MTNMENGQGRREFLAGAGFAALAMGIHLKRFLNYLCSIDNGAYFLAQITFNTSTFIK